MNAFGTEAEFSFSALKSGTQKPCDIEPVCLLSEAINI